MTPAELAAYVGAASWLPQIGTWIYSWRSRPQLTLSSAPRIEIGYTPFGPIVNVTSAISVERRDALVERIVLTSKHAKGDARAFNWVSWNDVGQQQIQNFAEGAMLDVVKSQPAIAMKVSTLALVERKIGFQDTEDFQVGYRLREVSAQDQFMSLRGRENADHAALATREFSELQRFFDDNLYWKEGEYRFDFALQEARLPKPHIESFKIDLTRSQIDDLKKNATRLQEYYKEQWAGLMGLKRNLVYFNWVYPEIRKLRN